MKITYKQAEAYLLVMDQALRRIDEQVHSQYYRLTQIHRLPYQYNNMREEDLQRQRQQFQTEADAYSKALHMIKQQMTEDPMYRKAYMRLRIKEDFRLPIDV